MGILNAANFVDIVAASIATLHGICIEDLEVCVKDYPATTLFG